MSIKIVHLKKEYKELIAVNDLSFDINEGEIFALLGLNGAGKTTLIKMLSTLTKPSGGEAYINGYSILNQANKIKEIMDISMQESAFARKLTIEENLEFYAKINNLSKEETIKRKKEIYEIFGFEKMKNKMAYKLSGGWQRKLSIAMSLIVKPKVLFLDEPTLGLDVISRRELWNVIKELKKEMTVILTTHYMEEAEELADRIGIINQGTLLFVGSKEELYTRTKTKNVEEAFVSLVLGGDLNA